MTRSMLASRAFAPRRLFFISRQRRDFFKLATDGSTNNRQHYVLTRKMRGTPKEVYEVVSEVSKYHEFIPYCTESFVNVRDSHKRPLEAGLRVGFREYDEKFVCKVQCKDISDSVKSVTAESLSHNLFHVLTSEWVIVALPGRSDFTEVKLILNYQFKSRLYSSVASFFAQSVTELILKAFDRRVYQLKKNGML